MEDAPDAHPAVEEIELPQIELNKKYYDWTQMLMAPEVGEHPEGILWKELLNLMAAMGFQSTRNGIGIFEPSNDLRETQVSHWTNLPSSSAKLLA
jgi:hypothetical protein